MTLASYDHNAVAQLLDYAGCIEAVREAMIVLSCSERLQPLRQIVTLGDKRLFGVMPGDLLGCDIFGAKLVSVFPDPCYLGRSRHQGIVTVFDASDGSLLCTADAESVTLIRTACATAAATDALARKDARSLSVFGSGAQAESHIRAISQVRALDKVVIWARTLERAASLANKLTNELELDVSATTDGESAASDADILCTVTASLTPVLLGRWLMPGCHVNLVGSSYLGPVEVDTELVKRGRFFADYMPGVLAQASEFAVARDVGAIDNSHAVGEIGEVFANKIEGRQSTDQVTIYKSLGHVVQDLAAATYVHQKAQNGTRK